MGTKKRWENKYALETEFDRLDLTNDEIIDLIRGKLELRNKFLKRAELKPMAKIRDDERSHLTSRAQHMRQAAEIAKDIAHRLGLNETVTYIGMLMHDAGHSFFGHEGEHAMSIIGKMLNTGYFHHNAKGIDVILSENVINEIIEAIPEAKKDKELRERLINDAWYFLDIVVSHDGEATSKDMTISAKENTEKKDIRRAVLDKVRKANRENMYKSESETLEGVVSKPADVISYIKTDLLDAFSEGIITRLDEDHFETIGAILCETREERDSNLEKGDDDKELRKTRIEKAKKLIMEYRKKHLREQEEEIDEEILKVTESIIEQVEKEGIDIFDMFIDEDMKTHMKNVKKNIKGKTYIERKKALGEEKKSFVEKYEKAVQTQKRINEILNEKMIEYTEKRRQQGADINTIASGANKIEEYLQKLLKERKRVVEDIMNDVQEALINDYIETTLENWEKVDGYEETKGAMSFSKGMNKILFEKLKNINYEKYVQYTNKVFQEKSVPSATYKAIQECARALVKTGVIRDKFYDSKVRSKVESEEVKDYMKTPERDEEEYRKFKSSIGISNGIKIIRPKKKDKMVRFTNPKGTKNLRKNKLFKEIYSYAQRQDTRFAMNCEDVFYAIEHTVRKKAEDSLLDESKVKTEEYLIEEQLEQLRGIRAEIEAINETENNIEVAKEIYIKRKVEEERQNLEEKVATEIVIRYLAGMTDKKIIKTLLKTGYLSWIDYKREDRPTETVNTAIKDLIESHKGEPKQQNTEMEQEK